MLRLRPIPHKLNKGLLLLFVSELKSLTHGFLGVLPEKIGLWHFTPPDYEHPCSTFPQLATAHLSSS
jgi:hypothetical protein